MAVQVAVPGMLGFMLGEGIQAIAYDKPYAITQTTVAVSGLGLYFKRRFEPMYKKTKRRLDSLFRTTKLTQNDIVWDIGWRFNKSNPLCLWKEKGRFSFEMQEAKDYIQKNAQDFLDEVLGFALELNFKKGYSIQKSVLNAVCISIDKNIPFFKERKTIESYIEDGLSLHLLMLNFLSKILKNTMQARCNEEVLDFLNKGIDDQDSPFYGVNARAISPLFFNQQPYQEGRSTAFKIMSATSYASLAGAVASSFFLPNTYQFGVMAITGGVWYSNYLLRKKNFATECSRFLSPSFHLKSIELKGMNQSVVNCVISWRQNETFLTSYGKADINLNILKKIKKAVRSMPEALIQTCLPDLLKRVLVNDNEKISQCYNGIEKGLSLEEASKKFGVSCVYEMMQSFVLIEKLKTLNDNHKSGLLFRLGILEADFNQQLIESKNEMDSRGITADTDDLDMLFKSVCYAMRKEDGRFENAPLYKELTVPNTVDMLVFRKVPKAIRKMQKDAKVHVKN